MTTISEHEVSVRLLNPGGDVPLSWAENSPGQVTLDSAAFPYVQGTVKIAVEDAMLLEDLDPRDSRRLAITAARDGGSPRTFNLGVREATPDRAGGTVTLRLASDEAVLMDYAQLVDDNGPRAHQASLRAVCNYVLGKIGAALQAGGPDADVTAYWSVTNLVPNPRLANDANAWQTGSGASGGGRLVMSAPLPPVGNTAYRWTAAAGDSNAVPLSALYRVTPGKWYVFTAYLCSGTTRQARAAIQWWSAGGSVASSTSYGAFITSDVTAFHRVSVIAQCPPGAEQAVPYINTVGNASGNLHYASCAMFHEGNEVIPYYDGATAAGGGYTHAWQAAVHASTSTRTPAVERRPEALRWSAGDSGMAFLETLLKSAGLRIVCDEQRRWFLRGNDYRAGGAQAYRYGVNIKTASESLSRDDNSWRDGAVYEYIWTDDDGIEQRRLDAFALPGASKIAKVELRNTPYPGPGRAQYMVERAQGTGRTVSVTANPAWDEVTDQALSILLEDTPIQTGIIASVRYDFGDDSVEITSRTTDTPAGAIDLLAGTINSLPGTINAL